MSFDILNNSKTIKAIKTLKYNFMSIYAKYLTQYSRVITYCFKNFQI